MSLKDKLRPYVEQLDKELHRNNKVGEYLGQAEKMTGVKRLNMVLGVIGVVLLVFLFTFGSELVINVVAFVYPAYRSVRAIESEAKDDDTQWLLYWVVYSYLHFVEFFIDIILWWFPFYYTFKLLLCVWCMAPIKQNGSKVLYENVVKPLVDRYGAELDKTEKELQDTIKNVSQDLQQSANDSLRQRVVSNVREHADHFRDESPPDLDFN